MHCLLTLEPFDPLVDDVLQSAPSDLLEHGAMG